MRFVMDCLVTTRTGWAAIYRRGYKLKSLLIRAVDACDCDTAGEFANGTQEAQELIRNGWKQIIVYPMV
jgi:hypothetical protein